MLDDGGTGGRGGDWSGIHAVDTQRVENDFYQNLEMNILRIFLN